VVLLRSYGRSERLTRKVVFCSNCLDYSASSEANISPGSKQFPHILWNLKIHYRVPKSLALVPVLSEVNSVHEFPSYSFEIRRILNFRLKLNVCDFSRLELY
jgi:hypothetical protein